MTTKQKSVPVTSLKLMAGKNPTFPLPVKVKNLDGKEFTIEFVAKAQRKSEWAAARDEFRNTASDKAEDTGEVEQPAEKADFSFVSMVNDGMRQTAELVHKCVSGWQLDDEFTVDALVALEDTCSGSLAATLSAYDAALFSGRLGN